MEETLSVLTDLVSAGKIRAIGSSKAPAHYIVKAQWAAARPGLQRFRTEQPPYSILNRGIERDVLPVCEQYGMGVLVWSPLAQGLLTGRYSKGQPTRSHRAGYGFKHLSDQRRLDAVEQLIPLGEQAGIKRAGRHQDCTHGHGLRGDASRHHLRDHRPAHHGPL